MPSTRRPIRRQSNSSRKLLSTLIAIMTWTQSCQCWDGARGGRSSTKCILIDTS